MLLTETLRWMAESFGSETAYSIVDGGFLTFDEWDAGANRLARGLVESGIQPDDRVAIHLSPGNAVRWLVTYAAVHRAGAVAVPLNPRLAASEVSRMLSHCSARAVVADGELVERAAILAGESDGVESLYLVVDATADGAVPLEGASAATRVSWQDLSSEDAGVFSVSRTEDDLADILYTSGTTGQPKGVAVRHGNLSLIGGSQPNWNGDKWLHASPMFTFAGLAFVYNPMLLGLSGIYQPRFDAGRWLEVVESERPVAVFLVPSMAQLLIDHPRFARADLSSVGLCSIGSAPLAPFVLERLQERMPEAAVSNNYGMTEAGSVYCLTPKGEAVRHPGSVGQLAPPAKVRIVGTDGGSLANGEIGEVQLQIPGRPREYFDDRDATERTWVDGWLITGDLGKVDDEGYLYIVGRHKDVIIRGGNNIHAADVEHVILRHPSVLDTAVVGSPHPVLGEDVVGFVVLRPGKEVDGEELRRYCLAELADYKVPRQWHFVSELPRNATGKVVKPELRRRLEGLAGVAGAAE